MGEIENRTRIDSLIEELKSLAEKLKVAVDDVARMIVSLCDKTGVYNAWDLKPSYFKKKLLKLFDRLSRKLRGPSLKRA